MYCAVSRDLGEIFFLKVFALNKRNCWKLLHIFMAVVVKQWSPLGWRNGEMWRINGIDSEVYRKPEQADQGGWDVGSSLEPIF